MPVTTTATDLDYGERGSAVLLEVNMSSPYSDGPVFWRVLSYRWCAWNQLALAFTSREAALAHYQAWMDENTEEATC